MNGVSIIINGVRYDAVIAKTDASCTGCELRQECRKHCLSQICCWGGNKNAVFKKSTKSFER